MNPRDLNTLSTEVLSFHCVSKEINSVVCLTCVILKCLSQKIILKLQSKTTLNSVFIETKFMKIGHEMTSGNFVQKNGCFIRNIQGILKASECINLSTVCIYNTQESHTGSVV